MQILEISFYVVVGIQIVYFLVYCIAFSKKQAEKQAVALPVSVIICAHDEEENLKELIPLLLAQDHPEFEIIIVDDRSNDGTFDLLLTETGKDHRLKMVHVNRTPPHVDTKKYALTLGIKSARYEWILLTDADCRPSGKDWISAMSTQFSDTTQFVLGYAPYMRKSGVLNAFIRFDTLVTAIQYIAFALLGRPYMGVGRNLAYRRSNFLEVKGFNNLLNVTGGDDDLFVNRHAKGSNTAVRMGAASLTHSFPKTTWKAFYNQKVRHLSVGRRYRIIPRFFLGLFMITWLLSWFGGIGLAFFSEQYYIILGLLVLRTIVFTITTQVAAKTLGERFEGWAVPVLDFIYAFYYLVTGLAASVTKKVRWKN
ncbi:glycosyltransferase [Chryseolinea soli]|uniref:glycosyltransferase n=1 Tax=Chryseolinea soli TaxID=2321403 RepID=UPI001E4DE9AE|nr:glycosyltransferase [Chryseolinea soli]